MEAAAIEFYGCLCPKRIGMALFPNISPLLERCSEQMQRSFHTLQSQLPQPIMKEYSSCIQRALANDAGSSHFANWYLHSCCRHAALLQLSLRMNEQLLFHFGASILPTSSETNGEIVLPDSLDYLHYETCRNELLMEIWVLFPVELAEPIELLLKREIVPFIVHYYADYTPLKQRMRCDRVGTLKRLLQWMAAPLIEQGTSLLIFHYKFQELPSILELLGERRTSQLLQQIRARLRQLAGEEHRIISADPISYLLLIAGEKMEDIGQFEAAQFNFELLSLQYELFCTAITDLPIEICQIYRDLKL